MKYLFSLVFLLSALFALGQRDYHSFAVINDPDGYTNVRSGPGSQHEVIGKVLEGEVFLVDASGSESENTWKQITLVLSGDLKQLSGYMHQSRIQMLSDLTLIKDIEVQIKPFNENLYRFEYQTESGAKMVIHQKTGDFFWGTDGSLPRRAYERLTFTYCGRTYSVAPSILANYFEPSPSWHYAYVDGAGNAYIIADNSDGAGGYTVVFSLNEQGVRHHFAWRFG